MTSDRPHQFARFVVRRSSCGLIGALLLLANLAGISPAADWAERQKVGRFLIRSEFALQNEGPLLDEMEALGIELSETLGIEIQGEATEIFLFQSRQSYQDYLSQRIPEGVNRPALFVKIENVSRVFAYRCPELGTNLRHEATHALLHSSLAIIPLWLDEGLAEYFEVPVGQRVHGNPHLLSLKKWNSRFSRPLHLQSLADKQEMAQMSTKDYRDAFSVIHFLIHGPPEVKELFRKYLSDIQQGEAPDSLDQQLARLYRRPEIAVSEHVRNW